MPGVLPVVELAVERNELELAVEFWLELRNDPPPPPAPLCEERKLLVDEDGLKAPFWPEKDPLSGLLDVVEGPKSNGESLMLLPPANELLGWKLCDG